MLSVETNAERLVIESLVVDSPTHGEENVTGAVVVLRVGQVKSNQNASQILFEQTMSYLGRCAPTTVGKLSIQYRSADVSPAVSLAISAVAQLLVHGDADVAAERQVRFGNGRDFELQMSAAGSHHSFDEDSLV